MTTLLLSARYTDDAQALWRVAGVRRWDVVRVPGLRVPPIDRAVVTASPYLRDGALARDNDHAAPAAELASATGFATEVLAAAPDTPRAIALDVGLLDDDRWAVVEANGAWGAGLDGCDPDRALDVIRAAIAP